MVAKAMNEAPLRSLDGYTPKEAFITLFGLEAHAKLFGE